jgi:hypothetical protein
MFLEPLRKTLDRGYFRNLKIEIFKQIRLYQTARVI